MKNKTLIALVTLFTISSAAKANIDLEGVYLSASVANVSYEISDAERRSIQEDFNGVGDSSFFDSDSGYQLKIGYRVNDFFSAEIGYLNLGNFGFGVDVDVDLVVDNSMYNVAGNIDSIYEVDGYVAGLLGHYPLTDNLTGFARVGLYNWEATGDVVTALTSTFQAQTSQSRESESLEGLGSSDHYFGFGFTYNFDLIELVAEYETFTLEDQDVSSFGIGTVYRF